MKTTHELTLENYSGWFKELYGDYYNEMFKYVCYFIRDVDETADIVQNIFIKIYRAMQNSKIWEYNIKAYLYTIARNECLNHLKKVNKMKIVHDQISSDHELSSRESYLNQLVDHLTIDEIINYLKLTRSESDVTIFLMRYIQDEKMVTISKVCKTSVSSISRTLKRLTLDVRDKFCDEFKGQ
jgi:RNA polymerase sigma-70 factor (ECF subfamily)